MPQASVIVPQVNSDWVGSYRYTVRDRRLKINLKTGGHYEYQSVPKKLVDQLENVRLSGGSVGSFISTNIINKFPTLREIPRTR